MNCDEDVEYKDTEAVLRNSCEYPNGLAFLLKYYANSILENNDYSLKFWDMFNDLIEGGQHELRSEEELKSMKFLVSKFLLWFNDKEEVTALSIKLENNITWLESVLKTIEATNGSLTLEFGERIGLNEDKSSFFKMNVFFLSFFWVHL